VCCCGGSPPRFNFGTTIITFFFKAVFEFLIEYCDSTVSTDGCLSDTILMHLKYTYQIFVGIGCFASQLICH
jgi:hypothetical protein